MPNARVSIQGIIRGTVPAVLCSVLGACIVVPVPFNDVKKAPELSPHVPPDLLTGTDDVLVLTQRTVSQRENLILKNYTTQAVVAAKVVKRSELANLEQAFSTESGANIFFFIAYGGAGIDRHLNASDKLDLLCILTAGGDQFPFRPLRADWTGGLRNNLYGARRDAIVAALRDPSRHPFEQVDGPCGMAGKLEVAAEARRLTIDFMGQLAAAQPPPTNPRIAALLRGAQATNAPETTALLLATGNWRDRKGTAPPLYLRATDLQRPGNLPDGLTEADFIALFPEFTALHAAGSHALENLSIDRVCMVGRDGEVHIWNPERHSWQNPETSPPARKWQDETLRRLQGKEPSSATSTGDCAPIRPAGWTATQLADVVAFIKAVPVNLASADSPQTGPHPATKVLQSMFLPRAWSDPANTAGMLLVIPSPSLNSEPMPLFVAPGRDTDRLTTLLKSILPGQLMHALEGARAANLSLDRLCLIAPNGAMVILSPDGDTAWKQIGPKPLGIGDLDDALRRLGPGAPTSGLRSHPLELCNLPQWEWTSAAGTKALSFLQEVKSRGQAR